MAEAVSGGPRVSPLAENERRRLQNRTAQRRFRQKKAMEARAAQLAEGQWNDLLSLAPYFHPTGILDVQPGHDTANPISLPSAAPTARAPGPAVDHDVSMWDSQLFGDVFFLNPGQPAVAEIVIPPAPPVPTIPPSPPSSTTSAASPGHSQLHGAAESNKAASADRQRDQQDMTRLDGNTILRVARAGAASDAARLTNGSMDLNPAASTIQLSEQLRAQVRREVAVDWKAGGKAGRPTWGSRDEAREPLLHTAAKKGDCKIVQMLLDHNADINERNSRGMTALHVAIEYQQEDAIMLLLGNGVDINAADDQGRTALSMAVNNSCESGVRLFLLHGADPTMGKGVNGRESSGSP